MDVKILAVLVAIFSDFFFPLFTFSGNCHIQHFSFLTKGLSLHLSSRECYKVKKMGGIPYSHLLLTFLCLYVSFQTFSIHVQAFISLPVLACSLHSEIIPYILLSSMSFFVVVNSCIFAYHSLFHSVGYSSIWMYHNYFSWSPFYGYLFILTETLLSSFWLQKNLAKTTVSCHIPSPQPSFPW